VGPIYSMVDFKKICMEMVDVKRMRPSISQSQMPSDSKVMKHKLSTCLAQTIVGTVWVLAEPLHIT
jgi:hypothetical protein